MKMNMRAICTAILAVAAFSHSAFAVVYPLPADNNSRLIGQNLEVEIPQDSKLPLEHFAAQYQMGLSNMLEANPGVDPYLPTPGSKLIIPHQLILPDTPHEGIVVNSAEMRLYYYPKGTKTVVVLPIGIGQLGKDTPVNWLTTVQRKQAGPTWTPTKAMHAEYAAEGKSLPSVFPAGPDNPMGLYAMYVGRLFAIHGTNANFGIGLRVSHGCVRLRADDIKYLFDHVPVGTRVQFIDEPVKATIEPDGSRYLEVHNPLSSTEEQFTSNEPVPITLPASVSKILVDQMVNQNVVNMALQNRSGIPVNVTAPDSNAPAVLPASAPANAPAAAPDSTQTAPQPAGDVPQPAPAADGTAQPTAPQAPATDGGAQPVQAPSGSSN
ncbi:L,D-transpeptidase family protein [Sodalis sp. RH16]|uniref:L,D-transpeptidase family protein n=1 Tax=unclassified Sodalis (in: enterobacteria) TaxID=2636512 RepID=UPI0039B51858